MAVATRQLGDANAVGFDQAGTGLFGTVQKLPHARIAARGFVINLDDRLGRGLQAHAHGMKAEENFGGGHAGIIVALAPPPSGATQPKRWRFTLRNGLLSNQ